ncbi:hypothetical protein ACLBWH_15400 [Sphingomonas sp. M6A6_1c]
MTALIAPRPSMRIDTAISRAPATVPRGTAAVGSDLALSSLTVALWLGVFGQKLALPGNIEFTLVVMVATIAFLLVTGRARLSLPRLLLFAVLVGSIAVSQAMAPHRPASISAILMAIVLYGALLFVVPLDDRQRVKLIGRFQVLALVVAMMVALQWICQIVGLPMPGIEGIVPQSLLFQSYNYIQPLTWHAAYLKPNGIVMLEASQASQLLAMAVMIEVCLFRRWWRVAVLISAQLATFGGTGFVLLLAGMLVIPFYLRGRAIAALAGLLLLVAIGTSFTPVWDNFARRSGEIGGEDSTSGRGRFVEPYLFMIDRLSADRPTLISGIGPGNGKRDLDRTGQLVMNPLVKAIVEYGLVTGMVWMLFVHICIVRTRMPFVVAFVVLVQYDVLNGALLVPLHLLYCWTLAGTHGWGSES